MSDRAPIPGRPPSDCTLALVWELSAPRPVVARKDEVKGYWWPDDGREIPVGTIVQHVPLARPGLVAPRGWEIDKEFAEYFTAGDPPLASLDKTLSRTIDELECCAAPGNHGERAAIDLCVLTLRKVRQSVQRRLRAGVK